VSNPASEYTPAFYAQDVDASVRTAAATLPEIFRFTGRPRSIVDFGTGVGFWLAAANALGVADVHGYDGDYVQPDQLRIPRDRFILHGLAGGASAPVLCWIPNTIETDLPAPSC
jgi:predicted RNA methylase